MKQLDKINNINDAKKLDCYEKKELASEIREFLIDKVSKNGGTFSIKFRSCRNNY